MADILEIEIKARCDDRDELIRRIESAGSVFLESREEVDIYYNHPSRNFAQTDEALRIRAVNGLCRLTYKGPKVSGRSKARIEHETEVKDFSQLRSIIESLGFIVSGTVRKNRSLYALDGIEICVDDVDDLGTFAELEKKGLLGQGIEDELYELAAKLGLSRFERRSYLELKYYS